MKVLLEEFDGGLDLAVRERKMLQLTCGILL